MANKRSQLIERLAIETPSLLGDLDWNDDPIHYLESLYDKRITEGIAYLDGVNNTFEHQMIQARIFRNYLKQFDDAILTETNLADDVRIVPDISIWGEYQYETKTISNPLLTIEITHSTRNNRYSKKAIEKSFSHVPSLQESFIYNYKKDQWTRYRRTDKGIEKDDGKDHSQVLEIFLHTLLK